MVNRELEIDLRGIFLPIVRGWKWILVTAVAAGVITLAAALLSPASYKAEAVVAVTRPRYVANFDPKYQTVDPSLYINKAYIDLANSDEILQGIYTTWSAQHKKTMSLDNFRKTVAEASYGNDPSIINLAIVSQDPNEVVRLANQWADLFTKRANEIYTGQDQNQLTFFNAQLADANKGVQDANRILEDFQKTNNTNTLSNLLGSLLAGQNENLQKQRAIEQSKNDALSLVAQLDALPVEAKINIVDDSSWTILRTRYYAAFFSADTNNKNPNPGLFQIQIPAQPPAELPTVLGRKQEIQNWIKALDQQYQANQDQLKTLDAQVQDLQTKIQVLQNKQKDLTLNRDLAVETFTTMSRKTTEVRISLQNSDGDVRVAARAIYPETPESKGLAALLGLAILAGLVLSSIALVVFSFLKELTSPLKKTSSQ